MKLNHFLIEAHKALDAATVEDGIGNEALCMMHLGKLHGLILLFCETPNDTSKFRCCLCGCTDTNACPEGCFWINPFLCSHCRDLDYAKSK